MTVAAGCDAVFESNSESDTMELGRLVGRAAAKGLFVGLAGELGTGKTVFVRGMARGMEFDGAVTSPTFQLVREYQGRERLFHFDFYRLGSSGEAVDLDIEDCISRGVVAVEWSDRFPDLEWSDHIGIRLVWTGETDRRIEVVSTGGGGVRLLETILEEARNWKS